MDPDRGRGPMKMERSWRNSPSTTTLAYSGRAPGCCSSLIGSACHAAAVRHTKTWTQYRAAVSLMQEKQSSGGRGEADLKGCVACHHLLQFGPSSVDLPGAQKACKGRGQQQQPAHTTAFTLRMLFPSGLALADASRSVWLHPHLCCGIYCCRGETLLEKQSTSLLLVTSRAGQSMYW